MKLIKSIALFSTLVVFLTACEATTTLQFTSSITPDVTDARSEYILYAFVQQNRTQLMEEASQGRGETLGAVAQVLGCAGEQEAEFISTIQHNHSEIFRLPSDSEISKNLLSHRCL